MEYTTIAPTSELSAFVKCYWVLRIPQDTPKGRQQILPDGCMDMIFNLADDVKRITEDGEIITQPKYFVLGQITKECWVEPMGEVDTFAVRFYPACFSYFTPLAMTELADKDTNLYDLFSENQVRQLINDITNAKNTNQRIKHVEEFLFALLKTQTDIDLLVKSTIDKIIETRGALGVSKILQNKQSERRKLERRFSTKVGLSPKQLCRIIRLQATLKDMLAGGKNLTHVGYDNAYYDQSHFIKDFKDFTGSTPKDFYGEENFKLSSILYSKD